MRFNLVVVCILIASPALPQEQKADVKRFHVKKGQQVILRTSSFVAQRDTVIAIPATEQKYLKITRAPSAIAAMFYDSLAQHAARGRVSRDVFDAVIKKKGRKEKLVNSIMPGEAVFQSYEGLKIRSIVVKSVDVLEGSVIDTLEHATTRLGKFINRVHRDTRTSLVERNLLFSVGENVDAYRMADNERVLRQFPPLRDARIYLSRSRRDPQTVDVVVVVQDVASFGFSGFRRSWEDFRLDVFNVNAAGSATAANVSYFRNAYYEPHNGYQVGVGHPNLFGTFIRGDVFYANNFIHEKAGVSLRRDYFTPEIKYGGGGAYYTTNESFYIDGYDTLHLPYSEKYVELWGGRSFEIRKRMNVIVNALVNPRKFYNRPFVSGDSNLFALDRTLVAGNAWLVKRNYLKSLRIRGFGRTEDIPIGFGVGAMLGREWREFGNRNVFQMEAFVARYFPKVGYLNVNLATATYVRKGRAEDGLIKLNATAFSDLVRIRRTQMRNFVFFDLSRGIERSLDKSLMLVGKWRDESGNIPIGNNRLSVGVESDYFMPWYVYGFQFTLFYRGDIYLLSANNDLIDSRALFYSVKAGVRTLNENLVLPGIALELGYFGKNDRFPAAWQVKVSTTLPDLFASDQSFKPRVRPFE